MITLTSQSGHEAYGLKSFTLDTADDIANLPVDVKAGSTAFVIDTGKVYMINSGGEWKEL